MTPRIYFDHNATAPLHPEIAEFLANTLSKLKGNPSSAHQEGQEVRNLITQARAKIAAYLRVKSNELIFTSGGTESVNMAIRGLLVQPIPGHIITSSVEHSCVMEVVKELEEKGYEITRLPVGAHGAVLPEAIRAAIQPNTQLIALMAVNNETGVRTDISGIAAIAHEKNIPFFVDAIAQLGKEEIAIVPGVSAMAFSGHKIHALPGTGLLFLRSGMKFRPFIVGGEQEYGRRAGTENVLGILSFAKAVELLSTKQMAFMKELRETFEKTLQQASPRILINGEGPRTSNVSNLAFLGMDGETMLMNLDRYGIAASHGSACSSGSLEPSRILLSMGLPRERVLSSMRFSFSRLNTFEEVEHACAIILSLLKP